jgi:iodothyronine deiodinase-like protein
MYARFKGRADFYGIYIREAHPVDGWRMESNDQAGIQVKQPRTNEERTQVAEKCCSSLAMSIPLLVDGIRNKVEQAYSGFPDRLYLIDTEGRVAYKGGRGPFGFKPEEMEQALALLLAAERTRDF